MFVVSFIFRFLFSFALLCMYDIVWSKRSLGKILVVENILFSLLATIVGSIFKAIF